MRELGLPGWLGHNYPNSSEYERGRRDGEAARRWDDARREYERGYRDGYGSGHAPEPWDRHIQWGNATMQGGLSAVDICKMNMG